MCAMTGFGIVAALTTLAAAFSWINYKYIRLPTTIGLMVISMVFSLGLVALGAMSPGVETPLHGLLDAIDFDDALLNGMLGALLFAGALHLNVNDLAEQKGVVAALATIGVLLSTAIVGIAGWWLFNTFGAEVRLLDALLFGALISPTDPIAVGAILRRAGIPKSLETKINGESLFNDGVGVVVFAVLLGIAGGGHEVTPIGIGQLFLEEAAGGIIYGAGLGWVAYRLLKSVDNYQVEILLTLALVTGGYALAQRLHVSGPLAMVVAGLLVGNHGRSFAMSSQTRDRLDAFWELVDEFLNAVLFVLIGIEVLVLDYRPATLLTGAIAIPVVLAARWISVGIPVRVMQRWRVFSPRVVTVLTWSGLRGGISVALALSLPQGDARDLIITVTYIIVAFSIIIQGLTVGPLVRRVVRT